MEMEKNKKNRYGFDFTPMGLDIKTFREAQKITREKLAETLDISPRHLQAIELEGKHPSLGLLAYIATIFDMPIDPYIFPEKADAKSAVRKRLDVLLDKLIILMLESHCFKVSEPPILYILMLESHHNM